MIRILLTILLGATFTSSTSAAITWQQPADPPGLTLTCIRIYHVGAEWPAGICFNDLQEGPQRLDIPGALPAAYRPQLGDRIVLAINETDVGSATLGEAAVYTLYLPLARKDAPGAAWRVYVAVWRG